MSRITRLKKYYNEEGALLKKSLNAFEGAKRELQEAEKRRRIARLLTYWGVWVSSGEVRIIKYDEYLRLYGNYLDQIEKGN